MSSYIGPSEFAHLHTHTIFSLLDGIAQPNDYFEQCAKNKWTALAITEHGVLSSIPDAYFASKQFNIKYIVGIEFYYCDYNNKRKELVSEGQKINEWRKNNQQLSNRIFRNRHITVLVKNEIGYCNLLQLNKIAWQDGFYRKPRIWFDILAKYQEGLIILSGCMNGPISYEIMNNNLSNQDILGAMQYATKFKRTFGDDFYIELQMPGVEGDVALFQSLVAIAREMNIKTVITNDCHYINLNDSILQKVLMAIDQQTTIDDPNLFYVNSNEQYLKTRADLWEKYLTGYNKGLDNDLFEKSCNNTLEIAEKCSTFKPDLNPKLPKIPNANEELIRLAYKGLKEKGLDKDEKKYPIDGKMVTHREQMIIELKRIIEKDFASYFLITRNLVKCSVEQGYPLGPARGSCGGCLVAYLIDIHSLNPLFWGLSFSRFLSPARGGNMLKVTMSTE